MNETAFIANNATENSETRQAQTRGFAEGPRGRRRGGIAAVEFVRVNRICSNCATVLVLPYDRTQKRGFGPP